MKPIDHVYLDTKDLRRVAVVPSHEDGHFIVDHSYFGKRLVGEVVLLGVSDEDLETMHSTGEFPLSEYVVTDEEGNARPINGHAEVIINSLDHGSNNTVTIGIESFREFAPVAVEPPAELH